MRNLIKYTLTISLVVFCIASKGQTDCGDGWLCGSATARVEMPDSTTDGIEISISGGISSGTTYKYYMCCASSSPNNACYLNSQSDSDMCYSGRTTGSFLNVRFR